MSELGALFGGIFMTYLAYGIGAVLFSRFKVAFKTRAGKIGYSITLGYGVIAFLGFLLVIFHLFYSSALWLLLLLGLLLLREKILSHLSALFRAGPSRIIRLTSSWFRQYWFLKLLFLIWIFGNLLLTFVPLTGHDTLDYHFPIIETVISSHELTYTDTLPSLRYLPVLGEIFYAVPTLFFSENASPYVFQVLQYLVIIIVSLLVWNTVAPRVKNKLFAYASVLTILSLMDFQREVLHGGYIDVIGFLFGIAAILYLIDRLEYTPHETRHYAFVGVFLGLALSVKYTGLFFVAISGFYMLIHFFIRKARLKYLILDFVILGIPVFLISSFWYIKNLVNFANPVYPMWTSAKVASDIGYFILDRTLPNFLYFPFYRYAQWFIQEVETSSRLIVLGLLIVAYLLIVIVATIKRRFTVTEIFLFISIELYFLFLFFSSHQYRFLLPATILLAPFVALLCDSLLETVESKMTRETKKQILNRAVAGLICAGFFFIYLGNLHYFAVKWKYIIGVYSEAEYIHNIGGQ